MSALDDLSGPEYRRLFAAARRSLERTGGVLDGQVSVASPTEAERKALIGLTGQYRPPGVTRITVGLGAIDAAVSASTGLSLADVVAAVDGRPLRHRPDEHARNVADRAAALALAESSPLFGACPWFRRWIEGLGPVLTKMIKQGSVSRLADAVRVLEAVEQRDGQDHPFLLPALAEQATGDTKALGRGMPVATLVLRALALRSRTDPPQNAEDARLLWDANGVVVDDLASRVLVLNLPAVGEGLGEWLSSATRFGTPFQVTLHQLIAHPVTTAVADVFLCENPAVLRRASQELGRDCPPMLCTEGRPSTAFHRLARVAVAGGARLHYHGDYDWDGIDMVNQVIARHGAVPWGMTEAEYREFARPADESIPLAGKPRPTHWEPGLAVAMRQGGVAVFEEAVGDRLIASLRS